MSLAESDANAGLAGTAGADTGLAGTAGADASLAGTAGAVYHAANLSYDHGYARFDACLAGECLARVILAVPGRHNASNALGCFALCHQAGLSADLIAAGLADFTGTGRRFEYRGTTGGIDIIDDYAHHPTEIAATLATAVQMTKGRILCVFQPHTYTRTRELFEDFANVLQRADETILLDIYAAREPDLGLVHSRDLEARIREKGGHSAYAASFTEASDMVRKMANPGDLVITMGAGDVYRVADLLLRPSPEQSR
jgi:UDP-N-acetylmuramate--alanine ligase